MDEAKFWSLIESARKKSVGDAERQVEILAQELSELPAEEIIAFQKTLDHLMAESYTWDLWAAAYIINGGCSDDCFDYFRGWLIAQGETVFRNALRDPETLVDVAEPGEDELEEFVELEEMLYLAYEAYESKTGTEFPMEVGDVRNAREPKGEEWTDDDLPTKYPKLWAKF